jgi:hypothetical protein
LLLFAFAINLFSAAVDVYSFLDLLLPVGLLFYSLLSLFSGSVHASHMHVQGASEHIWLSFSSVLNSFKFHSLQAARQMHGREDYQRLAGVTG